MHPIKRLPPHVVQHIAAGEVIEKPVSIIKELIDNALDAQATRIEIEVAQGGREKLTVSDNGHGIERKSIPLVFERYATSKIASLEDFRSIGSLGFRGEALHSIMSAADVTLMTRSYREQEGTWVRTYQGTVEEVHPTGCRIGTTVIIDRLFSRYPVRKQALNAKKDFAKIKSLIVQFAIIYREVSFILKHNGSIVLSFFDHEEKILRVSKYWDIPSNRILSFEHQGDTFSWLLLLSHPEHFASHRQHQTIAINGRPVQDLALDQAIDQGLTTFRHSGKYARYFLGLKVPSEFIDINIHPQKQTVTLAHQIDITSSLQENLKNFLSQLPATQLAYSGDIIFPIEYASVKESSDIYISGPYVQLHQTYILCSTQDGFLLVDQHAADERLWYNKLLKDQLLLSTIEKNLTSECKAELDDDIYQHSFSEEINARIATIACHQAIRAGEILSQDQMSQVISQLLEQKSQAIVCPHGRPTHIKISQHQLDALFRRK